MRVSRKSGSDIDRVRGFLRDADERDLDNADASHLLLIKALKLVDHHLLNVSRDKSAWIIVRNEVLVRMAENAERRSKTDEALRLAADASRTMSDATPKDLALRTTVVYARLLMTSGIYDRSLENFYTARELAQSLNDDSSLGIIQGNIATILFNTRHYQEALSSFERASELFEKIGEPSRHAQSIRGVGMTLSKQGRYGDALEMYRKAVGIIEQSGKEHVRERISIEESIGVDYLNLADTKSQQKHYKEALKHFYHALELSELLSEPIHKAVALRNIAQVLAEDTYKGNNLHLALSMFQEALRISIDSGVKLLESQILRELSKLQERLGFISEALKTFREFYDRERDVLSEQTESRIRSFEIRTAVERSEQEVRMQRERSELLEAELDRLRRQVTSTSLAIGHKNAALRDARSRLRHLAAHAASEDASELRQIVKQIQLAEQAETYWDELEEQLSLIHGKALQRLALKHPQLTPTERRVCSLILHNLSSKDIARLLSAELRSVEKYRQRIRKKLGLTGSDNLANFLASLE